MTVQFRYEEQAGGANHWSLIEQYKAAWSARMDAGHFGSIQRDEEGNSYGPGVILNGCMTLRPQSSATP